jgi:general secretion pathway protein L
LTTLYIRHPAKASIDSAGGAIGAIGATTGAALCQFALAGDGGNLLQQGAAALGSLTDLVASARRVVLLLSAADVSLLRVKMPPLSPARLRAALPNLVEEHILGEPGDNALAAAASQGADGLRAVAVVQQAWLAAIVKALLVQGARNIAALPAQLCLPLPPGGVAAAIETDDVGLELTLRLGVDEGLGLSMASQPLAALQTLRSFAGDAPVTLYLAPTQLPVYQELLGVVPGITLEAEHWAHWIAASKSAPIDLVPALGSAGAQARNWRRWRWPIGLAALAALVNIVGLNVEWLRLQRDADLVSASITQIFRAAYPKETVIVDAPLQMRRNIAAATANGGQAGADDFITLAAAYAEAIAGLPRKDVTATLDYREHALFVKPRADTVDAAAQKQIKAALAQRNLDLSETTPGTWQIRPIRDGAAGGNQTKREAIQ